MPKRLVVLGLVFAPSALQITACYLREFPTAGMALPWFKLGVGSYISEMKVEGGQVDSQNRTSRFGTNIGVGTDFAIGPRWQMGVSGTYHHFQRMKVPPPGPPTNFDPSHPPPGGDFEATGVYTIDVGLTWRFGDRRGQ
jgi:opacity protein-like surface antigen